MRHCGHELPVEIEAHRDPLKSKLEGLFDTRHRMRIAERSATVVDFEHTQPSCSNPLHRRHRAASRRADDAAAPPSSVAAVSRTRQQGFELGARVSFVPAAEVLGLKDVVATEQRREKSPTSPPESHR